MGIIDCTRKSSKSGSLVPNSCINEYIGQKGFTYPETGELLAPWVAIDFVDSQTKNSATGTTSAGAVVTVSNQSSDGTDPKHCAIIKSFSLGHSDGTDVRVTIHDTHGGLFEEFMKHLQTDWFCLKTPTPTLLMRVQFGWVKSGCKEPMPSARSECYYVFCNSVETNYAEGKIIFEIVGRDICFNMPEGSAQFQTGGNGDKAEYFINALKTFLTDPSSPAPNIPIFKFVLTNNKGEQIVHAIDFNSNTSENKTDFFNLPTKKEKLLGRFGKYNAQGLNKLEAIQKWAAINPSINDRAWRLLYNTNVNPGELIFFEVASPNCDNQGDAYFDALNEGTYIVNGGPSSPVIEFNPKLKWNFPSLTGASGAMGQNKVADIMVKDEVGAQNPGHPCLKRDKVEGAGQITGTEVHESKLEEGDGATRSDAQLKAEFKKFNPIVPESISADLVVIGDPVFCPPMFAVGTKFISIVIINPFHIVPNGDGDCGEWLALPACNPVLSNKGWKVTSVTHQIDAGKYTTTIGVNLPSPGIELYADKRFGGWVKGWKPKNTCA